MRIVSYVRRSAVYRRLISYILLLGFGYYLGGCSTMRRVSREDIYHVQGKPSVWVTMADGTRHEVKEPRIEDSKLIGYVEGEGDKEIDFSEIEFLEVKEIDKKKTMKLVAVGITGGIVLIWALTAEDSDEPPCPT